MAVHSAFLLLISAAAATAHHLAKSDSSSLLYTLVSGDEIVAGPLDPSAYAQTDAPGIGGARLAVADGGLNVDIITFDDPEVEFAAQLGGNAVIAPLSPLAPEPGSDEAEPGDAPVKIAEPHVYTVEAGDTISSIAAKFNISTNTVLWANGLSGRDTIRAGDHLTILPTTGVLHTVKSGDTLSGIAQKYDVLSKDITEFNRLESGDKLSIGDKLVIPDGYIEPTPPPSRSVIARQPEEGTAADDGPTPPPSGDTGVGMVWPTTTRHISQYFRWGHTGIDVDNRAKPPVYAAAAGTIEFAGWLGGYGNLIIVNHGNGLQTYYAHLEKFYASKGQAVAKGAAIAKMGSTGRSTGPHVHFEVRRYGRPINPLGML